MVRTCLTTAAAALTALLLVATSPAQAQTAHRAWVSGHGTDAAGCGAPTAPCRSLQYTHDSVIAAGGEIDVLDPAGYGAITITKAIGIVNDGVGTAGVQATVGAAIAINAGTGAVVLRGLDIEGVGAADGIRLIAGGPLTVEDSTIDGFSDAGIRYEPQTSGYLYVSNTRVTDSGPPGGIGSLGIEVHPVIASGSATVQAILAHIEAVNDVYGVYVDGSASGQGVTVNTTLADSIVSNNSRSDVFSTTTASNAPTFVMVRNSVLTFAITAVEAFGSGAIVDVAHSTLNGNLTAFGNVGGVVGSFGDNDVDGNTNLGAPTALSLH